MEEVRFLKSDLVSLLRTGITSFASKVFVLTTVMKSLQRKKVLQGLKLIITLKQM